MSRPALKLHERHEPLAAGRLPVMEGTGAVERIHVARYRFAAAFSRGKDVLDIASGIGYGSLLLATEGGAAAVTGADISSEAIGAAQERYNHPALAFRRIDPGPLPFADRSFGVVASFETVEHTADAGLFLNELWRVLRPGGVLVISTPNKRFHSFGRLRPWNPHHAREHTPDGFRALLRGRTVEPEFWGGQGFLAATPAAILRTNWIEFRYYRLLGRPVYNALRRLLNPARWLAGAFPRTGGSTGTEAEQTGVFRSEVIPWQEGLEPYTMVAVCRKPFAEGEQSPAAFPS